MVLFTIHLTLALGFTFLVFPRLGETISGLDPDGYGHLGRVLYESGRFASVDKPPLYPAFLALVAAISGGYHVVALQAAQCLVSALSVVVLYRVFQRTLPGAGIADAGLAGEGMARLAGLACALYPLAVWYAPRLWTETFLTWWIAVFTWALLRLLHSPTGRNAALCGLAAGLAALTKGVALALAPLALAALVFCLRKRGRRPAVVFSVAVLALLLPWTWRNWQVTGSVLPVHAEGGYNFYLGNGFARHWPEAPLSYVHLKALTEADMPPIPADPLERDRVLLQAGLRQMATRPGLILRKALFGGLSFWYLAADPSKSALTGALQLPFVLLAAAGLWRRRHVLSQPGDEARGFWVLLLPVVGIWAASAAVLAFGRLSAPVMPYVIGLALVGIWPQALKNRPDTSQAG